MTRAVLIYARGPIVYVHDSYNDDTWVIKQAQKVFVYCVTEQHCYNYDTLVIKLVR